jgi:hypothetical protein
MTNSPPFRTSADLIAAALSRLGVLASGQSIDVEDYQTVSDELDALLRKLAALEICYVPDEDNIQPEWFSDLADILAGESAVKFGVTNDDYVKLVNRGLGGAGGVPIGAGTAAMSLKIMQRGKPTYEILRTESF